MTLKKLVVAGLAVAALHERAVDVACRVIEKDRADALVGVRAAGDRAGRGAVGSAVIRSAEREVIAVVPEERDDILLHLRAGCHD